MTRMIDYSDTLNEMIHEREHMNNINDIIESFYISKHLILKYSSPYHDDLNNLRNEIIKYHDSNKLNDLVYKDLIDDITTYLNINTDH